MKLIVSTFLVYKVKKYLLKSGKVRFFLLAAHDFFLLAHGEIFACPGKNKSG